MLQPSLIWFLRLIAVLFVPTQMQNGILNISLCQINHWITSIRTNDNIGPEQRRSNGCNCRTRSQVGNDLPCQDVDLIRIMCQLFKIPQQDYGTWPYGGARPELLGVITLMIMIIIIVMTLNDVKYNIATVSRKYLPHMK